MTTAEQENSTCQTPAITAAKMFRSSPYQAIRCLKCGFRDGVLTIEGCLPSFHLTQLALTAVRDLEGVTRIENRIEVAD